MDRLSEIKSRIPDNNNVFTFTLDDVRWLVSEVERLGEALREIAFRASTHQGAFEIADTARAALEAKEPE